MKDALILQLLTLIWWVLEQCDSLEVIRENIFHSLLPLEQGFTYFPLSKAGDHKGFRKVLYPKTRYQFYLSKVIPLTVEDSCILVNPYNLSWVYLHPIASRIQSLQFLPNAHALKYLRVSGLYEPCYFHVMLSCPLLSTWIFVEPHSQLVFLDVASIINSDRHHCKTPWPSINYLRIF